MSVPVVTELDWEGTRVELLADGSVRVTDRSGHPIASVSIGLPAPWQLTEPSVLADEITLTASHPSGANARLSQVWDATWGLRVAVSNPTAEPLVVPGPTLTARCALPAQVWSAGAAGHVLVQLPTAGPAVLGMRLVRGRAVAPEQDPGPAPGTTPVAELRSPPLELGRAGEALAHQSWSVTADVVTRGAVAGWLPSWWPESTAAAEPAEWLLPMPDGVVTGPGVELEGEVFALRPPAGASRYEVSRGSDRVDLDLWVAPTMDEAIVRLLGTSAPGAGAPDAGRVVLALAARDRGLTAEVHEDWVDQAEELALRLLDGELPQPPGIDGSAEPEPITDPVAALALALAVGSGVGGAAAVAALESVRLATSVPGSELAHARVGLALLAAGRSAAAMVPTRATGAQEEISRIERSLLAGRDETGVSRAIELLGAGLPGEVLVCPEWSAVLVAASSFAVGTGGAGSAGDGQGDVLTLGRVAEGQRLRLTAATADPRALAWLLAAPVEG